MVPFCSFFIQETRKAIRDFRKNKILEEVDSCFIIIMSHGKEGGFFTADTHYEFMHEKDVTEQFNNSSCPALIGKPKVFIYQYCRYTITPKSKDHKLQLVLVIIQLFTPIFWLKNRRNRR